MKNYSDSNNISKLLTKNQWRDISNAFSCTLDLIDVSERFARWESTRLLTTETFLTIKKISWNGKKIAGDGNNICVKLTIRLYNLNGSSLLSLEVQRIGLSKEKVQNIAAACKVLHKKKWKGKKREGRKDSCATVSS